LTQKRLRWPPVALNCIFVQVVAHATTDTPRKGRGAISNPALRYSDTRVETVDDGWDAEADELPPLPTVVRADPARTIIAHNNSPDVGFSQSINPYRGCEHGCVYCFARPRTHTSITRPASISRRSSTTRRTQRRCSSKSSRIPLRLQADHARLEHRSVSTARAQARSDAQHPRSLRRDAPPYSIVTKGATILRDLDLIAEAARARLVSVFVSITSLDHDIKRTLEPRTASPEKRFQIVSALAEAGVPVGVLVAPVIPLVTDPDLEAILERAHAAGARWAGYVLLRLPLEIRDLFDEWLKAHAPLKAEHVMSLMRQMHGGREYDSRWGVRQRGNGPYAELLARRFELACQRLGINEEDRFELDTTQFRRPSPGGQLDLL
jgi:DNA repair photolyase